MSTADGFQARSHELLPMQLREEQHVRPAVQDGKKIAANQVQEAAVEGGCIAFQLNLFPLHLRS